MSVMSKEVVKPYKQEGSKKKQVETMFDNVAKHYDLLNRVLSMGIDTIWRKNAISTLTSSDPKVILDVATGTGDLALEIAKRLNPTKIVGLDLSQEMLNVGTKKIAKKGLSDLIEMVHGDSENLPFDDNTFDAVTVSFGVRNFENLEKGLLEIQRVLKKDGKLVVLEFSQPTLFPFKQVFHGYFKYILPAIGKITSKDPKAYKYLYESVQAFPDQKKFTNILTKLGYKSSQCKPQTLGICSIYTGQK